MATIVFMGTPDFSIPILQQLIDNHTVIGVVTQPDRPAGRKQQVQMSPIKQLALQHNIPVLQPEKLRRPEAITELKQWQPDLYVVAAFGQILPQSVLDIPKHGSINVHASLLPRWRGAAPIQAAIREGDAETGVTIMKMDAGLDTGPMLKMRAIPITPDETGQSLHDKLSTLGAELLMETLPDYLNGLITPQPQPEAGVTFAPQVRKEEGNIVWTQPAEVIERLIRAFTPWPGTFTYFKGQQLKIINGSVVEGTAQAGKVVQQQKSLAVGTGQGLLRLNVIQLAGRKAMPVDEFVKGQADFTAATLGAGVGTSPSSNT
ncbi:MAG: methionyl-tRNA formyltransferase [Chloroflexi bacterium]|nr:methionyl-tRNA formyltransferase [Chloroflexota bacterium]MCC6896462.1 methionyl-tRNA formyltransferase [Anaerolineae bacterium]